MRPSGGGYRPQVTPEAATCLGLPPSVLRIGLAIGQQSTDSNRACHAGADRTSDAHRRRYVNRELQWAVDLYLG
jgi:hypothetical protein